MLNHLGGWYFVMLDIWPFLRFIVFSLDVKYFNGKIFLWLVALLLNVQPDYGLSGAH